MSRIVGQTLLVSDAHMLVPTNDLSFPYAAAFIQAVHGKGSTLPLIQRYERSY